MNFTKSIERFLGEHVNLNEARLDRARATFDTISSFLRNADQTKDLFIEATRQGSLRQKTIIKPRADDTEFDVDLLLKLARRDGWNARDYLGAVRAAFDASDRYSDKMKDPAPTRCETVEYAGDFHVDIVPCIEQDHQDWIMNRDRNQFEPTDGDGYAAWFAKQDATTGGQLVKVTRLLKYLRDEHDWPLKSILLTTMVGERVTDGDTTALYPDLPSSLRLLVDRWDSWLQSQQSAPEICNPALRSEAFRRHWDDDVFKAVRNEVNSVASKIRGAFDSDDEEASSGKWKEVFGDSFTILDEDLKGGLVVATAAVPAVASSGHARPITDIAASERLSNTVQIHASLYSPNGKHLFRGISSGTRVRSGLKIKFRASTNVSEPFSVHWQVVNTGHHAEAKGALRGGFFAGKNLDNTAGNKLVNWESTEYTGTHWIECFVVKDGVVVARDRFYVPIKNPAV
jgi:hypothetical protein